MNSSAFFVLQRLVLPHLHSHAPEEMYVRRNYGHGILSLRDSSISMDKGCEISFDTYFNALTVKVWKQHTSVGDLSLFLSGKGRFLLRFGLHQQGGLQQWLSEAEITLRQEEQRIPLESWQCLTEGLLYLSLTALEDDATVTGGYYATQTAPECEARLGIVITHYNRREYVLPAIQKIRKGLLEDPYLRDRIELIVVDNSQTILAEEATGATLIANRNLGGSGGFMRGLLYLEDSKRFTHCLFMDDDASCEPDSIRRTYAILSYAKTPKLAVAGSLLRELEPFRLMETGALFNGHFHPINYKLDVREIPALLNAESRRIVPNYGAWWFFGFKLSDVCSYAFPFFVRGDDVAFSIMNGFEICTLNGVASWGPDFTYKAVPKTRYLDARSHLTLQLTASLFTRTVICGFIHRFFREQLYSYCYASAAAVSLGLKHVCEGPRFWSENIAMSGVFQQLSAIPSDEKMTPLDPSQYHLQRFQRRRRSIYKLWRLLTFNGFLVPSCFFKKRVLFQEKGFCGDTWAIFRYKKVYYEYGPSGCGFVAKHDKKRFFKEYLIFLRRLFTFWLHFDKIRGDYQKALPELTSRHFWKNTFSS